MVKKNRLRIEWEEIVKRDFREIGTSWRVQRVRHQINWDRKEACVVMLASGGLVLRCAASSGSLIHPTEEHWQWSYPCI